MRPAKAGEWDRALTLLRRWREYISPDLLSYLRGSIWLEAGIPEVAVVFFGHASEGNPEDANYRAIYMHALTESDPGAAAGLAQQVLADYENYAPVVVARAADIRFNETRTTRDAESAQEYRELIAILETNLMRIENDEDAASRKSNLREVGGPARLLPRVLGERGSRGAVLLARASGEPEKRWVTRRAGNSPVWQ